MLIELHMLQNFAPSNLNRDDTGSPKDCEFGGHRRARISSQCLKRAIRKESGFAEFLASRGGVRTRRLIPEIAERITDDRPVPEKVTDLVAEVFREGGIERPAARRGEDAERENTRLILFMDRAAIDRMAACLRENWQALQDGKGPDKARVIAALGEMLVESAKVPDVALFGRMVEIEASKPFGKLQLRLDAACQVAHALSANRVSIDFDFFTAVDDLPPSGDRGASMMGTVEFNSACFYRYANIDLDQLQRNLAGDRELALRTLEAFLRAAIAAVPTGKQNSMAAHNPPSLILAVARESGLWSLANAFVKPVRPTAQDDLVESSVRALDDYWGKLVGMYGDAGLAGRWVCALDGNGLHHLAGARVPTVAALVDQICSTAASAPA